MWRGFDEFDFSTEQWVYNLYEDPYRRAHYIYIINRALRRAVRDGVISKEEQKNLWKMIQASKEDCCVAIVCLENKYKQLKTKK